MKLKIHSVFDKHEVILAGLVQYLCMCCLPCGHLLLCYGLGMPGEIDVALHALCRWHIGHGNFTQGSWPSTFSSRGQHHQQQHDEQWWHLPCRVIWQV